MAQTQSHRAGNSIVYVVVIMTAMLGMASFAVDYGRVQLAKTQIRIATDAAARAGVLALSGGSNSAKTAAKAVALANLIDGTGLTLTNADITVGKWNSSTGNFSSGSSGANAIQISAQRSASRGTAIPLNFASILGRNTCNVTASSIAYIQNAININATVPATSNPWLAGMPNGTKANVGNPANDPDVAPAESPYQATGITLYAGQVLQFTSISGSGTNDPGGATTGPDGDSTWINSNFGGSEHGMSNVTAPMNSLVAVFLDDNTPSNYTAPTSLDFTTAASRDFTNLSPQLRQVFFIGDGQTSGGVTQQFIVPSGATRLFLASMDGYQWSNNQGSRTVQATQPQQISLVQ